MTVTNKLTIHMDDHRPVPRIEAVQGDANTRALELTLLSGGAAWTVPADTEVSVAYDKSDGTRGWYDTLPDGTAACAVTGNVITAILAPQVLTAAGRVQVVVILRDKNGSSQLAAFPVTVLVVSNPAARSEISNDYYHYTSLGEMNQALEKMSEELARLLGYEESARQSAEEAAANAQEAEASALEAEAKAPLICTVTGSPTSGKMVCDRTVAEVWAAHQAGRYVYAIHGGRVFGPVDVYETTAQFGSVDGQSQYQITLIADGTVVFESISMAKAGDIPTVLPNPHALTINGAPYDGSEAVELEIPEPLICTVTGSDAAGYSCDTSWAQIREAADQGRVVLARESYTFYYLRFITSSYAEFTHISGEYSRTLTIYNDGSAPTIETVTLAQGASTALPTPTAADAGKVPVVKEDGSGYELGEVAGGSTAGKDGGYYTPTVDEAGNLTWTASKADMPTVDGANIKGPQGEQGPQGPAGAPGPAGPTPNIQIGTVDTLPAGSAATATMGGTPENPTLNLGIPQGVPGSGGGVHTFRHIQTITIPENEEIVKIDFTIPAKTRKLYVVAQTNSSSTFGSIVRFNVRNGNVFLAALNVQQSMEHRKALFSAELYDDIQFASFASSNAIFATPYPGYATFNDYASYFPVADNTLSIFIYGSSSTNNFFIAGSTFDLYALCEE